MSLFWANVVFFVEWFCLPAPGGFGWVTVLVLAIVCWFYTRVFTCIIHIYIDTFIEIYTASQT